VSSVHLAASVAAAAQHAFHRPLSSRPLVQSRLLMRLPCAAPASKRAAHLLTHAESIPVRLRPGGAAVFLEQFVFAAKRPLQHKHLVLEVQGGWPAGGGGVCACSV
jgi:hypothetical protein